MANIALIDSNNVVIYIVPSLAFVPEGVTYASTQDATGASVGYTWNGTGYDAPPDPATRTITRADFQRRFTPTEFFAAKQLAQTDANMAYIFGLFESSQEVRLDHPDTASGVGYMQQAGILTAERVAAILS